MASILDSVPAPAEHHEDEHDKAKKPVEHAVVPKKHEQLTHRLFNDVATVVERTERSVGDSIVLGITVGASMAWLEAIKEFLMTLLPDNAGYVKLTVALLMSLVLAVVTMFTRKESALVRAEE